ncbi:hypothetical protein RhiJN_03310 [Ceratobasidium sp. AG-Ba]|nr:hypothetical protein RhiJN_03310 [Ceratobasidium sp. AG-Ba]QRW04208.1 hypothetical protein RhiLY_03207 [Ceratobasidium sp. AG-Ba]
MGKKRWPDQQQSIQISNVRYHQRVLVSNLLRYPYLGVFTRSLSWEISDDYSWQYGLRLPAEDVWSAFQMLDALHTLDLEVNVGVDTPAPEAPLFPNLKVARIEGQFPKGSLERILHTSPYLRELRIVGKETTEHRGSFRSIGRDITSFLQSSVDKGAFPRLQVLELCVARGTDLDAVAQFIAAHAQTLVELRVELANEADASSEWFQTCLLPLFQTNDWLNLRLLTLSNVSVPLVR